MKASEKEYDDLTQINGIADARQRWLRESLDVHTYQDLASLSVDEIESQLKAEGQIASPAVIAKWLRQAQELSATSRRPSGSPAEGEVKATGRINSPVKEDGWKPFASFVVEFQSRTAEDQTEEQQTAVHHIEADTGAKWPGITGEQPFHWMLEQVAAEVRRAPEKHLTEEQPAARAVARMEVVQIRAFQPPQADMPVGSADSGHAFKGQIRGGEPFTLEVSFRLVGAAAGEVMEMQPACRTRFFAYNLSTGKSMQLGEAQPEDLDEGRLVYTALLTDATLRPGTYRLWVLAAVQPALAVPGYLEVPLFQVV